MFVFPPTKELDLALSELYERDEKEYELVLDLYENYPEDEFLDDYAMYQAYNHFSD